MANETDALLGLIDQENARVIHYQEERANTTNIIFLVAGAVVAAISIDQQICGWIDTLLAAIISLSGLLGMFLNAKYHERVHYHEQLQHEYSRKLGKLLPQAGIAKVKAKVRKAATTESLHRLILYKSTLWVTWVGVNAITVGIGVALLLKSMGTHC